MEAILWALLIACLLGAFASLAVLAVGLWQEYKYRQFEVAFMEALSKGTNPRRSNK